MLTHARPNAIAIHICADRARRGPDNCWPPLASFADSVRRAVAICDHAGIVEQRTLAGEHATRAALLGALSDAGADLADGGLLVLMFAGHCERGDGPIETARWCLASQTGTLADLVAQFPRRDHRRHVLSGCDCTRACRPSAGTGARELG
jgi:hypothetical protein